MQCAKWLTASSLFLVAVWTTTTSVQANTILTIQNPSFETPEVTSSDQNGAGWNDTASTGWSRDSNSSGRISNSINSYHVDGVTGNQFAYLYAEPISGSYGSIWQGVAPVEAGASYTLSADIVGMACFAASSTGAQMEMRIGYSPDGVTLTQLASKTIAFSDVYNATLANQKMTNFSLTTNAIASNSPALIGTNYIGVWFGITAAPAGSVNFGIDNVQLSSATVPEPSVIGLLISGVIGALAYPWRKR